MQAEEPTTSSNPAACGTGPGRCVFTADDVALLRLVAMNVSRAEMAEQLSCSRSTVTRNLATLCQRLGVRTTIEAVVAAVRAGVV